MKNKYHILLNNIIKEGLTQKNKKGDIQFLVNQTISMDNSDLQNIFRNHKIAKAKLREELNLYMLGATSVRQYNEVGIEWWDYCSPKLIKSYPTYFQNLPALLDKINSEKRPSKNYVLFIGANGVETNQLPCLSLIQFQIVGGKLYITVFQRSADCSLGLPSDIYQVSLIAGMIDVPLENITFFIGNAHIYENNIEPTKLLFKGQYPKFNLNV